MKNTVRQIAFVAACAVATAAVAAPATYKVDPEHTHPSFEADHFGGMSVWRGRFNESTGTVVIDREAKTGTVDIVIDTNSIDFGLEKLESHVKSGDAGMLDTAKFPTATYKGKLVKFKDGAPTEVAGELTLHGVTKPVTLDVTLVGAGVNPLNKKVTVGFEATGTLKRSEFGVKTYVPLIGDDLHLTIAGAFERQD
jgi:polyisoprenoid-binding protein YceI